MTDDRLERAKDEALTAFRAEPPGHRNCAQAALLCAARLLDEDPGIVDLARYLGGGIGRSGRTCGVLLGAALALGLRDRRDPERWADAAGEGCARLQQLFEDFAQRFGATECRHLIGCDMSTTAGQERFKAEGLRERQCVGYLAWTCDRLPGLIQWETA